MAFPAVLAAAAPFILKGLDIVGNQMGAERQAEHNMELAKYQNRYNTRMLRQQRIYDLPANQRKRLEAAGLNPALMYGTGSDVAKVGQPLRSADIQSADFQSVLANIGTSLAQNRLMQSQADLTDQKVAESGIKQSLMETQKAVLAANPNLDSSYMTALISSMESTAALKKQQLGFQEIHNMKAIEKVTREIELMAQKFNLNTADQKIKAEILKSQEFQNYINEMKKRWLSDGEISGDLVRFGALMLMERLK